MEVIRTYLSLGFCRTTSIDMEYNSSHVDRNSQCEGRSSHITSHRSPINDGIIELVQWWNDLLRLLSTDDIDIYFFCSNFYSYLYFSMPPTHIYFYSSCLPINDNDETFEIFSFLLYIFSLHSSILLRSYRSRSLDRMAFHILLVHVFVKRFHCSIVVTVYIADMSTYK